MHKKKILCATDLTERSDRALQRAALLAQKLDAHVMFVHAVSDAQAGRVVRMKVNRAHVRLVSQCQRAMKHAPERATVAVRLGKWLRVITEVAREWEPDLIVMATPRRRRVEFLLGTAAERMIRATRRPVLVVSAAATIAYENVLLATDLSSMSAHVTRTAATLGLLESANTCVVHAFRPPLEGLVTRSSLEQDVVAAHDQHWHGWVQRELIENLARAGIDPERVRVSARPARPYDAVQYAMIETRADLLVIGTSRWFMLKRILFGSVADQVLRRANCDVLAVSPTVGRATALRAA